MRELISFVLLFCTLTFAQRVACVGNSLTYTSYPEYLNAKTYATVKRFGDPGSTMIKSHPHSYWNTTAFTDLMDWNPELTIILLGTNETGFWNNTIAYKYENDYRDFLTYLDGYIYLGIIPYVMPKDSRTEQNSYVDQANTIIRQIATESGLKIIDFGSALKPEHYLSDGIHINDAGQQVMAQVAYDVIKVDIPCIDTDWQPPTSTVWEGELFTQTSNCGNTQNATGTKEKIIVEDIMLTFLYNKQTKSLELSWTDISETGQYKLRKAWYIASNQLVENWEMFTNDEHLYLDTNVVSPHTYYYYVEAFKDEYWSHKSNTIEFNLMIEKYWEAVNDYKNQKTGLFNGCSWRPPQ